MTNFCAAVNCVNNNRGVNFDKDVSFFRFPKNENRCKQWIINCRRKDLENRSTYDLNRNYRLCSKHFEPTQYYDTNIGGKRTIISAVPTIFDVQNPPSLLGSKRKARFQCRVEAVQPKLEKMSAEEIGIMDITNATDHSYCVAESQNEECNSRKIISAIPTIYDVPNPPSLLGSKRRAPFQCRVEAVQPKRVNMSAEQVEIMDITNATDHNYCVAESQNEECKSRKIISAIPTIYDVPNPPPLIGSKHKAPFQRLVGTVQPKRVNMSAEQVEIMDITNATDNSYYVAEPQNQEYQSRKIIATIPTIFDVPNPPPLIGSKHKAPFQRLVETVQPKRVNVSAEPQNQECRGNCDRSKKLRKALASSRVQVHRLIKKVKTLNEKLKLKQHCDASKDHIIRLSAEYLTSEQLQLFESQLKMNRRSKTGRRWTVSDKALALQLLNHSPQKFNCLREIFTLPCRTTILKFLSEIDGSLQEGFSE